MKIDGNHFRDIEANCWNAEKRILDCQKTGVDVQVLSTVPVMFNYWAQPRDCLQVAEYLVFYFLKVSL